ncbi:cold shock domain-containing protein [Streptomyces rishiriensis]|uniref:cold shock domain-containing protein n=1 Tax=Streptomyces rishiriensis TaxID=68264 RepID=UPI0033DF0194
MGDALSQVIQRAHAMPRHVQLPDDDHRTRDPHTELSLGSAVLTGRIKWFDSREGMGYIAVSQGHEVPVHCQDFKVFLRAPKPGEQVEFVIENGWASDVRLLRLPDH